MGGAMSTPIGRTRRHPAAIVIAALLVALVTPWADVRAAANAPPTIAVDVSVVSAAEGTTASATGTVFDPDDDTVSVSSDIGAAQLTGLNSPGSGTWSWSLPVLDGPDTIVGTITVDDGNGGTASVQVTVNVTNTDPIAETRGPTYVPVGADQRTFRWTARDYHLDTVTPTTSCGAGTLVTEDGSAAHPWDVSGDITCSFTNPGSTKVGVTATDEDGGTTDARMAVVASPQITTFGDAPHVLIAEPGTTSGGMGLGFGGSLATADLDGNGRADLVVGNGIYTWPGTPVDGTGVVAVYLDPTDAPTHSLADATPPHGFRIYRETPTDEFGMTMAGAGDVNGDGLEDVVIGAPRADPLGRTHAGTAWVIYGSSTPADIHVDSLDPSQGFRIDGPTSDDFLGNAVAGGADVNGDGYDDVVVAVPFASTDASSVVVVFGSPDGGDVDAASLGTRGFAITTPSLIGRSNDAVAVGRFDADRFADVAIGVPSGGDGHGEVDVAYGSASPADLDLSNPPAGTATRIWGQGPPNDDREFGTSVALADVNRDGRADLVAGAPVVHDRSFVVFGRDDRPAMQQLVPSLAALLINGTPFANIGTAAAAGDLDGDGRAEVILGDPLFQELGAVTGAVYAVSFDSELEPVDVGTLTWAWRRVDSDAPGNQTGWSIAVGDVTGDGLGDLIIGESSPDGGRVAIFPGVAFPPDHAAPKVTTPGMRIAKATVPGSVPLDIHWTGTDGTGSGIVRYELQSSRNGATYQAVTLPNRLATSVVKAFRLGTYRFRVRARDRAGNIGPWVYGATRSIGAISDGSTSIAHRWMWGFDYGSNYWGGAGSWAKHKDATATVAFTGRSIGLVSSVGPGRGKARIYIDGRLVATVDTLAPTETWRQVVWLKSWTSSHRHTITVKVLGTTGRPRFWVDGFILIR
jgi:hypothetical protein